MIHVLATIEVAPGRRDEFLSEFRKLVPLVRAEIGCLAYGPAVDDQADLSLPSPERGNAVVVIEQWESAAALQAHLAAPHMQEFRARVKPLVQKIELQVLRPA